MSAVKIKKQIGILRKALMPCPEIKITRWIKTCRIPKEYVLVVGLFFVFNWEVISFLLAAFIWKTQRQKKKFHLTTSDAHRNLKWKKCCQVLIVPWECVYAHLCVCVVWLANARAISINRQGFQGSYLYQDFCHLWSMWYTKKKKKVLSFWHWILSWQILFQFPVFYIHFPFTPAQVTALWRRGEVILQFLSLLKRRKKYFLCFFF